MSHRVLIAAIVLAAVSAQAQVKMPANSPDVPLQASTEDIAGNLRVGDGIDAGWLNIAALSTPTAGTFTTAATGGTLTHSTTYYYRVSATNSGGETLSFSEVSKLTGAGADTATVTVVWNQVTGATGYRVYGRTTGAELKIGTITSGSTLSFTDTGSVTPSGALPAANTTGSASIAGAASVTGVLTSNGHNNSGTLNNSGGLDAGWLNLDGGATIVGSVIIGGTLQVVGDADAGNYNTAGTLSVGGASSLVGNITFVEGRLHTSTGRANGISAWNAHAIGLSANGSVFEGPFKPRANQGFRYIACSSNVAGIGGTTGFVLRVRNLTDAATLCTKNMGACSTAAHTAMVADCDGNASAEKVYQLQVDTTSDCATYPTDTICNIETAL